MFDFEKVKRFIPFLRDAFGPDVEILLCDTEKILYAEHPITDRVAPGNRLGDMERAFMEEGAYRNKDAVTNYRALLPSRERLRSSTYFLKDDDGSLAGFLTINIQVEKLLQARETLDIVINGSSAHGAGGAERSAPRPKSDPVPELLSRYEGVNVMVEDIIHAVIEESLADLGVPAERLTSGERQQIVQKLDHRGVFLVKGSIAEVAQRLGCSEVTIYRYLQ